jgi:hypothetical protein
VREQQNTRSTAASARRLEFGILAEIILQEAEANKDARHIIVVPNITLSASTGSTYYQLSAAPMAQTDAGGEAISARAGKRSILLSRIDSFMALLKDWSGEHTVPLDRHTLSLAKALVRELPGNLPAPQATLSPDGEIAFTWFKDRNRFEALLQPDHHLVWTTRIGTQYIPGLDIDISSEASFAALFDALTVFLK